jgi:hypothetical protein
MAVQDNYTADEWQAVLSAPTAAGLLVTLGDISGPIGLAQEASAVVKATVDTAAGSSSEVIKAIGETVKERKKLDMPDLPKERDQARAALFDICKRATEIVSQKAPGESSEYKTWLMTVAHKTAEASKEGGFLGFGGTRVSEGETVAINELAAAIGANAT